MKIQFISGTNTIDLEFPQFGYYVDLYLSLVIGEYFGNVDAWDNGIAYDKRILNLDLLLPENEMLDLVDFLKNTDARNSEFTLRIPESENNFYPAGPDKGNSGDFIVSLINQKQSGVKISPYKWFNDGLQLLITPPDTILPNHVLEGDFSIGSVSGLMYPDITPDTTTGIERKVSSGNSLYYVDSGTKSDMFFSKIKQPCNVSNAALLIDFIQSLNGRGNKIILQSPSEYYIFGAEFVNYLTTFVKLKNNVITIKHENWNQFSISFDFLRSH